jgi:RNA polymerase sigma factor (sigma-70 family)
MARTTADDRDDFSQRATRVLGEHLPALERLIASYARSPADRADLRQDVALAFWSALPRFRGECSEKTFLLRVAHNRALHFLRKRGAATDDLADHEDRVEATTGKNPAIRFERGEQRSRLLDAVRALPVPHRQVMTMMLEGLSQGEIAVALGTTENNVAVRANRARAALRVLLEEHTTEERTES